MRQAAEELLRQPEAARTKKTAVLSKQRRSDQWLYTGNSGNDRSKSDEKSDENKNQKTSDESY